MPQLAPCAAQATIACCHDMSTASHFSLLVVDDEPDLRTLYELTLLREGYDVETAGSVEDACCT